MGSYLNPGSKGFVESLQSEIYVDKSKLIEITNAKVNTKHMRTYDSVIKRISLRF